MKWVDVLHDIAWALWPIRQYTHIYSDGGWSPKARSRSPTIDKKWARVMYVYMFVCMYVCMHVCVYVWFWQISGDLKHRASPKWYHTIAAWIVHCLGMKLLGCGRHPTSAWHVILASITLTLVESLRAKYSTRQFNENFWWQIKICSSAMRCNAVYFCLLYRQIIGIPI